MNLRQFPRLLKRLLVCFAFLTTGVSLPCRSATVSSDKGEAPAKGLPFLRVYPYDEIGYASRTARISFDQHGRVALVREGAFFVLNDDAWVNLIQESLPGMVRLVMGQDRKLYFGSRRLFGRAVVSEAGKLVPDVIATRNPPPWIVPAFFDDIVPTREGVYFGSWYGVAFVRYDSDEVVFLDVKNECRLIAFGERVFAATKDGGIFEIVADGAGKTLRVSTDNGPVVDCAMPLDDAHALVSTTSNELLLFDGKELRPWLADPRVLSLRKISCIQKLADGDVAVSELGSGLFLFSKDGRVRRSYTTSRFRQISDIASNESGVLWLATEDAVVKVLYDCPLEDFGRELGLLPNWPLVAELDASTYVLSDRTFYSLEKARGGKTSEFRPIPSQLPAGGDCLAGDGRVMLAGSPDGIYELQGKSFVKVSDFPSASKLALIGSDLCMLLSTDEIGLIRRQGDRWTEACPRIPGLGFSPIVHASSEGMLVETANNGVALVSFDAGSASLSVTKIRPWPEAEWTSASILGDVAMLTGRYRQRCFYDLRTRQFVARKDLDEVLDKSEQWIIRLHKGTDGTLWGLSNKSLIAFFSKGQGYTVDQTSFDYINNLYPSATVLPSGAVWITASQGLFRVDTTYRPAEKPPGRLSIISLADTFSGTELWTGKAAASGILQLSATENSISIRTFSGTYRNRRAPAYAYRLNDAPWLAVESGSLLSFRDLSEGDHDLAIRALDGPAAKLESAHLRLSIAPPWYRSAPAKLAYLALSLLGFYGAMRLSSRVARKRSEMLERLVSERTGQLEKAMERLNEETRVAATLAERNRLAGEIHDSLQQGLSGAILQLDSTINLPAVDARVRSRLGVVRNMISFTRHEVQNAVWDKESPLLGESELGEALRKLTAFVNSDSNRIEVFVEGEPRPLPTETKHHLMRIAQEATTNAVRHAKASTIKISLAYNPDEVLMRVEDDGVGFDPKAAMNLDLGHFGLRGLQSRAQRLRATLEIDSAPDSGTRIAVRLKA